MTMATKRKGRDSSAPRTPDAIAQLIADSSAKAAPA
jgi:hypothetical protein